MSASVAGSHMLITGASSGLGYVTARELARRGAELTLIMRDGQKAQRTVAALERETGSSKIRWELADLSLMSEVEALVERLKNAAPQSRLVVLGGQVDGLLVRDLFACSVLGYLFLGDDLGDCLPPALGTVLNNRPYLSPTANAEYLVAMQSPLRNWQLDSEARAVLRLLARGLHISQIAEQMDVPLRRIYWVRQKLRKCFGDNTNEHLISMAVSEGFSYPRE